jgi:hypothetical protein
MKRWWMGLLGVSVVVAVVACGASPPTSSAAPEAASDDTCPLLNAGPPAVCPEGCDWNGTVCRKGSGIIMPGSTLDGGLPK